MSREKFEVFCKYEDYSQTLNVYIFIDNPDGSRAIITSLDSGEAKTYEPHMPIEKPTFRITGGMAQCFLQAFANELYTLGIKAEEAPILANELVATKYHLEDMRALVFQDNVIINKEEKK